MKFAFFILGDFNSQTDRAVIHNGLSQIVGVSSIEEACVLAKELMAQGVNCIELCGAFGPAGAEALIRATENKIPIGYVTHLPKQDELHRQFFSKP